MILFPTLLHQKLQRQVSASLTQSQDYVSPWLCLSWGPPRRTFVLKLDFDAFVLLVGDVDLSDGRGMWFHHQNLCKQKIAAVMPGLFGALGVWSWGVAATQQQYPSEPVDKPHKRNNLLLLHSHRFFVKKLHFPNSHVGHWLCPRIKSTLEGETFATGFKNILTGNAI